MISLKSAKDLAVMRDAGKILAEILRRLEAEIKIGISTAEIDRRVEEYIKAAKVQAAFKGYRGYPASICVSVNEEIVHGIPGSRVLKDGDLVSLDLGISNEGFFVDAAVTLSLGRVDAKIIKLIEVTRQALSEGIGKATVGNNLSDISCAVSDYVEKQGFAVVREFVGHGIGRQLHEEPEIPNFATSSKGPRLVQGMVLAIEPMVNMGHWKSKVLEDGWTAVTSDGLPSAHFEHTVAVTEKGPWILTQ